MSGRETREAHARVTAGLAGGLDVGAAGRRDSRSRDGDGPDGVGLG